MITDIEILIPSWFEQANCASTDPELFFPEKGGRSTAARAICSRCEVITECGQRADDMGEEFGIWGGRSRRDRRETRAERKAAA